MNRTDTGGGPVARAVRRTARLAAAVVAAGVIWPVAVAAADQSVVFEVVTTAVGLSVSSTQRPAASVITGGLVDSSIGYSSSAVSSAGASSSDAAAFYPGDLVATGPTLLCSEFLPCPVTPPAYPLIAQASYPERPAGSVDSPAPVGTAHASAREQATEGTTDVTHAAAPGTPVVVSVGAQTTTTRAWADASGGHVRSATTLHDVVLGPLRVALLAATDLVDVTTAGRVSDHPEVELSGVTFAGLAASVDDTGVHLVGVSQPLPDRQLAEQGIDIRALGTTRTDASGAARSTAGGLQATFSMPVQGVPPVVPGLPGANRTYVGTITVGGVGAAVGVGGPDQPLLAALPPAPASSLDARLLPARRLGGLVPAAGAGVMVGAAPSAQVAAPAPRRSSFPPADLRTLALVLAVLPTSLLVGWRVAARWRSS